ncbi:MAG: hypothetical protein WAL22_07575 [Solirubrobacteraceae bacterium]
MRSVSGRKRATGVGCTVVAAGIAVAGCATTQQEAVRLQLNSARIRASENPTKVAVAGRALRVTRVALVRGRTGSAIVVALHNPGRRTISDLPISVGVRTGDARQRPLNVRSSSELSYFDAHVPVIAAGRTVTWVYATSHRTPAGARPYAIVGARPSVRAPRVTAAPAISATARGQVRWFPGTAVTLHNRSSIPQYQLQVYVVARHGRRYVAAGALTVPHLGSGGRHTVVVPLFGHRGRGRLEFEALPTIVG